MAEPRKIIDQSQKQLFEMFFFVHERGDDTRIRKKMTKGLKVKDLSFEYHSFETIRKKYCT